MASSGFGLKSTATHRSERVHLNTPPISVGSSSSSSYSSLNSAARSGNNGQAHANHSVRSKDRPSSLRRSITPNSRSYSKDDLRQHDSGRVRVAVRLRPRNTEDLILDADFADCVELQPELKRLKLRKNNWSSESYKFDEVLTDTASQKRVYEVVAKPVVESVLSGYNGTVMAYGQTGTGKTYTVGRLGKDDASERGIMVRALEDIMSNTSIVSDSVEVSFMQLYMESVQDLLAPEKNNIPINEDPKTGEVSLPGALVVKVQSIDHFMELLQIGEANRHAANTKLNTESSRSHAILMVSVRRTINEKIEDGIKSLNIETKIDSHGDRAIPVVRKSKLIIVDLAGSERINKSGSEGHLLEEAKFINLSLTSLGKCINALAENSSHIPTRDSKLTRLLRDSIGGSARTSLIIAIGPSSRHQSETTSTILFGQRAMKIVNMLKLKEEFDYESLCRKLQTQVDLLTEEVERQQKLRVSEKHELGSRLEELQHSLAEAEKNLLTISEFVEKENTRLELERKDMLADLSCQKDNKIVLHDKIEQLEMSLKQTKKEQLENSTYQIVLADTTQMYERKITELIKQLENEKIQSRSYEEQKDKMTKLLSDHQNSIQQEQLENSTYQIVLADTTQMYEKKITELIKQLESEQIQSRSCEEQLDKMTKLLSDHRKSIQQHEIKYSMYQKALADTTQMYEKKITNLVTQSEDEHVQFEATEEQLDLAKKLLDDYQNSMQTMQKENDELRVNIEETCQLHKSAADELQCLKCDYLDLVKQKDQLSEEVLAVKQRILVEEKQRKDLEYELAKLKKSAPENDNEFEDKKSYMKENLDQGSPAFGTQMGTHKSYPLRETQSGQRATIAKICEEVGLQKILQLLKSEDSDVQIHAVKVVANLAAEDANQVKIVEEGGLDALLMLLQSSQNTTILRVASGAIANLAMNEINQGLIMSRGGSLLLAKTASKTNDPQTLRMVAGALANLCGNEKLHVKLKKDGGIKALLGMVRTGSTEVIAQVARGMANFAKCESRAITQGHKKGCSLLLDEGGLEWLTLNSCISSASTRRHVELALCHLSQNEDNMKDFISCGGVKELIRISSESSREDIRNLAKKILNSSSVLQAELHEEWR